jgi:two-component system sensor histidine kinase/response regulator
LTRQGAQVDVAENGRIAVDRVLGGQHYDAVLMDMQMPVMDGLAAARELRRYFPREELPIVAMTANAMDTDREACLAVGMNDHVAKPFSIERVVAVVRKYAARSGGYAGAPVTQPPPPLHELPVFDRAGALDRMGGDEDLLESVLPVFLGNLETAARELGASTGREPLELARLMHSIKGMASNVGAMALAAAAGEADQQIRAKPQPWPESAVKQVLEAIEEVRTELGARP